MPTSNSNPFAIGFTMVGFIVFIFALVVHFLTEKFTGLYIFSLVFFVIGIFLNLGEDS